MEGTRLGRYRILKRVASGGMAELYFGTREGAAGFRKPVAIKVLHPHLAEDPEIAGMFLDEAHLASRIHHPNVVDTEDLEEFAGNYCIVLQYIHGAALSSLVPRVAELGRRLDPELAVSLIVDAARGLHAAHEARDEKSIPLGIVHQDVSPQNILVSDEGLVQLIDFGVARSRARYDESRGKGIRGKLRYMAPEQMRMESVDRRADVFALGIVLWEVLSGRRIYGTRENVEVVAAVMQGLPRVSSVVDVPAALDDVLAAALSNDRNERPATARLFREMLLDAVPGARLVDPLDRAAIVMGVYGDVLAARRVELDLIDQSALSPEEMRTLPADALDRWTQPLEPGTRISMLFPGRPEGSLSQSPEAEVTEIEIDWVRSPADPIANR